MRRLRRGAVAVLAACSLLVAMAPAAEARTDTTGKRVLLVHGYDPWGDPTSSCDMWSTYESALSSYGFSGPMTTIGYYDTQVACDVSVIPYGSPSVHQAPSGGVHDRYVEIEHLGYELAWTIYERWSRHGETVDLVAHSMGGLVTRYALAQVQRGHPDFPPALLVEDVVTFGTPHGGSGYANWCWTTQCGDMGYGSSFQSWIASHARNPQVGSGTDWTVIGSEDDGVIDDASAVAMDAAHKVIYLDGEGIGHGDYYTSTSTSGSSRVRYADDGGPWYGWYSAYWPVKWSAYGLYVGSW